MGKNKVMCSDEGYYVSLVKKKKERVGLTEKVMVSLCAERRHAAKVTVKVSSLNWSAPQPPACPPACRCSAGALIPIKGICV